MYSIPTSQERNHLCSLACNYARRCFVQVPRSMCLHLVLDTSALELSPESLGSLKNLRMTYQLKSWTILSAALLSARSRTSLATPFASLANNPAKKLSAKAAGEPTKPSMIRVRRSKVSQATSLTSN